MKKIIGLLVAIVLIISLGACSNSNTSQGSASTLDNGKTSAASTTTATGKKVNSDTKTSSSSSCTFKTHNSAKN